MQNLFAAAFGAYVAYYYGDRIGYLSPFPPDSSTRAWLEGGFFGFFGAAAFGGLILWPILRQIVHLILGLAARGMLALTRKAFDIPPELLASTDEEVRVLVENGTEFRYFGLVDRDFRYRGQNGTAKYRLRSDFTVKRNTRIMTPRERRYVRILKVLMLHGLSARKADKFHFALAYGDGRSEVYSGPVYRPFRAPLALQAELPLRDARDLVRLEAARRGASVEEALSQLTAILAAWASMPDAHEEIAGLYRELQRVKDD